MLLSLSLTSFKIVNSSDVCVQTLLSGLKDLASSGEEFDILQPFQRFAMDSVGETSFGLELGVQKSKKVPLVLEQLEEYSLRNLNTTKELIASMWR